MARMCTKGPRGRRNACPGPSAPARGPPRQVDMKGLEKTAAAPGGTHGCTPSGHPSQALPKDLRALRGRRDHRQHKSPRLATGTFPECENASEQPASSFSIGASVQDRPSCKKSLRFAIFSQKSTFSLSSKSLGEQASPSPPSPSSGQSPARRTQSKPAPFSILHSHTRAWHTKWRPPCASRARTCPAAAMSSCRVPDCQASALG